MNCKDCDDTLCLYRNVINKGKKCVNEIDGHYEPLNMPPEGVIGKACNIGVTMQVVDDGGLTWVDVKDIVRIADDILHFGENGEMPFPNEQAYYEKVLDEWKKTRRDEDIK